MNFIVRDVWRPWHSDERAIEYHIQCGRYDEDGLNEMIQYINKYGYDGGYSLRPAGVQ